MKDLGTVGAEFVGTGFQDKGAMLLRRIMERLK